MVDIGIRPRQAPAARIAAESAPHVLVHQLLQVGAASRAQRTHDHVGAHAAFDGHVASRVGQRAIAAVVDDGDPHLLRAATTRSRSFAGVPTASASEGARPEHRARGPGLSGPRVCVTDRLATMFVHDAQVPADELARFAAARPGAAWCNDCAALTSGCRSR